MPPSPDQAEISQRMRRVSSTGTGPELALLAAVRRRGARPQVNCADLPGKPDIVFRGDRLACFVDGEYWHGGQWRRRGLSHLDQQFANARNPAYWITKLHRNIQRDLRSLRELTDLGWRVVRFWARDIEADPDAIADRLLAMRKSAGAPEPIDAGVARFGAAADFFAGVGLMRLGLAGAGWDSRWANDHDPGKNLLYRRNAGPGPDHLDPRPIQALTPADVPHVGLAAACFPCTDLSLAGVRRGLEAGPQSSAYLAFAKLLRSLDERRPPFVLLENVVGLINSHGGGDLRTCLRLLAEAGYTVDALRLDARHFVPQSRPRLFIVGVRTDYHPDLATLDPASLEPGETRPDALLRFIAANPDLPWAPRPLPPLPTRRDDLADLLDPLADDDPKWWPADRVDRLRGQVSDRHRDRLAALVARDGVARAPGFRRMRHGRPMTELRFDGLAGCLRTPKGGSAKQVLVQVEPDRWRARYLTARECARLMGAEDFDLAPDAVSENAALFGFGDGVCVSAVSWLVRHYINPLAAEGLRGRLLGPPR